MSEPGTDREWLDALSSLYAAAGGPTMRAVADAAEGPSHTTVHQALRGVVVPSWRTASKIIEALGGDPPTLHERWLQAVEHRARLRALADKNHSPLGNVRPITRVATMASDIHEIRLLLERIALAMEKKK